jgi:hypothetical protein
MAFHSISWCHTFKLQDDCLLSHISELITSTSITVHVNKEEDTPVIVAVTYNTEPQYGDMFINILKKISVRRRNKAV